MLSKVQDFLHREIEDRAPVKQVMAAEALADLYIDPTRLRQNRLEELRNLSDFGTFLQRPRSEVPKDVRIFEYTSVDKAEKS